MRGHLNACHKWVHLFVTKINVPMLVNKVSILVQVSNDGTCIATTSNSQTIKREVLVESESSDSLYVKDEVWDSLRELASVFICYLLEPSPGCVPGDCRAHADKQ